MPGLQPVAHRGLIAVVDLDVLQLRRALRDRGEIVDDFCAVTRGPKQYQEHQPVGRFGSGERWMITRDFLRKPAEQRGPVGSLAGRERLQLAGFSRCEFQPLRIHYDLNGTRA